MKTAKWAGVALGAGLALGTTEARASFPAGVWAKAEKVVVEPSKEAPTRIQIHGAFMVHDASNQGPYAGYTAPSCGFFYYECPESDLETCLLEWKDIEENTSAIIDECVGWGEHSVATGTLRKAGAPVESPDAYPIAMGILQGHVPCQMLATYLKGLPGQACPAPGEGGGGAGGGAPGAGGGAAGTGGSSAGAGGDPGKGGSDAELRGGEESGCSVGPGSSGGLGGLSLLAVAWAASRLRRARRGARNPSES